MEALEKVFETIMQVIEIIKNFLKELGFNFGDDAEGDVEADA